jgi:phage tail protein X
MTRLAWGLAALAIAAVVAGPVVAIAAGVPAGTALDYGAGIGLVFSICFPAMGALIVRRRGSHAVGWLLSFIGVTIALHTFVDIWSRTALIWEPGSLPGGVLASWITIWLWMPGWFAVTTLLPAMFPDGGRRRLAALDAAAIAAMTLATAVLAWPLRGHIDEPVNPTPELAAHYDRLNSVFLPEVAIVAALTVASFGSLLVRYRRSSADVRRQIAWVIYGLAVAVVLSVIGANESVGNWVQFFEALAIVGGLAIAMFRHHLYDIGVVVNRTLVYSAVTALLAGAYLGCVLLLQLILSPSSDLAIAASTLAVAALFRPARNRVQAFVDRRFYRRRYDAQRTLDAFAARLRNDVTLEALDAELRTVVRETVQPAHVSLWVRP